MNILKALSASFMLIIGLYSFANTPIIEQEVYISDFDKDLIELIQKNPALTIDHMSSRGFELYGPNGMKTWLEQIGVNYTEKSHHIHNKNKMDSVYANYPSFKEVENNLKKFVALNPKIAKLFSIGKSVEGRDLWVVKISDNVEIDEVEPEFKYISSMHGDEITGRELTQFLIRDIITKYGKDQRITDLVNNTEIFIMPSMNPDGSEKRIRANAKRSDLNRNFPDWVRGDVNSEKSRQVETKAVMNFQAQRQFALSANFHGGSVVVNYPWDNTLTRHPFDKIIKELSLKYASENPAMRNSREFAGGVTNGADWYVVSGGMQDWSYHWHNDLQVTVELSSKKWPRYSDIPSFYKDNKESLLVYMNEIHQGAGFKLAQSKKSGKVKIIQLNANGLQKNRGVYGFQKGEFYKYLEQGDYEFHVTVDGTNLAKIVKATVDGKLRDNGNFVQVN